MPPPGKRSGPQDEPESRKRFGRLHSNQQGQNSAPTISGPSTTLGSGGGRAPL